MKINFTQQHMEKLSSLALDMLFTNEHISTSLGTQLNIVEILHTTTIDTLNKIKYNLTKGIEKLEAEDEWIVDNSQQRKLESLKAKKDLINLVIGYKRFLLEKESNRIKKKDLQRKIDELKESQKTPDEKIKELESELSSLD